jgi:arginine/lysine/ornithine decarboxylase
MADVVRLHLTVDTSAVAALSARLDAVAAEIAARGDSMWAGYDEAVELLHEMQDEAESYGGVQLVDSRVLDDEQVVVLSHRLYALANALEHLLRDVA